MHIEIGRRPPIQKKKWRLFNERIDSLKLSLRLGNRDLKTTGTLCVTYVKNAELNKSEGVLNK